MTTTRTILRLGAVVACALLGATTAEKAQARGLTLEERVAAQQAIEQVYWAHRIWPDANPGPKPQLATVLSEPEIRAKVVRALSLSISVEAVRHQPLTSAELQEELDRMAAETKAPDTLRELFAALQDDPVLIAECLARPALVSRLARDSGIHEDGPERELAELDQATIDPPVAGYAIPVILGGGCTNDSWAVSSLTGGTGTNVPAARQLHTAVWTGTELIVWGGSNGGTGAFNNGGVYDPATNAWLVSSLTNATGLNVPSARYRHTAVWTGTEMIVWGGRNAAGTALNNGGRYNPTTDLWTDSPTLETGTGTNVPSARQFHTAIWTGATMIIWGGTPDTAANAFNNGGVFVPATDTWTNSILTDGTGTNVPVARIDHTAVWTGDVMIVWGGRGTGGADLANGGQYDPVSNGWVFSLLTTGGGTNVPSARHFHTAVWTGAEMIIWGGVSGASSVNTGGRYNLVADAWQSSILTTGSGTRVPTARQHHTAIWTGFEMVVWGGSTDGVSGTLNTGGRYGPGIDAWAVTSLTSATGARVPTPRQDHTAVWTGAEMIVWGGSSGTPTGGLFCATCPFVAWHQDLDGDGFGTAVTITSCAQPGGYVAPTGDCDDTNPAVHPTAAETCDGLDDDCDTVVDNGGDVLCADADACSADVCQGTGGCAAPPATANLDTTGFSASRVDGRDLVVLADAWTSCPGDPLYNAAANLDQGTSSPANCVDLPDFHLFMNSFGQACP